MEYRILGKTGLRVSRMGFGGLPIQRANEEDCRKILLHLSELGVNYIDTARAYTVSEGYIGKAIAGMRDRFVIASKSMARDKESMARDIELSLQNLQTDYIDLYQVHNPNPAAFETVIGPGGALEALLEAKKAGKIGHIGFTSHTADMFRRALQEDWVETVMFPYNIVESQGEELIAACRERNVGFIDMKPLAGGAIEDATLAIRYILNNDAVSVVIPGMATAEELAQNVAAASDTAPLTAAEQRAIHELRETLGSEFCRRCG